MPLTIDRQPGMVHIRLPDGSCVVCIEAAAFAWIEQALREQFIAAAERVSKGEKA